MNLICKADWPLDAPALEWLPGHVRNVFEEAGQTLNVIRFINREPLIDWWNSDVFSGVTLTVYLHDGPFRDHEDILRSGIYWPGENKIDMDWKLEEREPWRKILEHEMQHFMGEQIPGFAWGEFGHGRANDPLIIALKQVLRKYHGDVTLHHKDVDRPL